MKLHFPVDNLFRRPTSTFLKNLMCCCIKKFILIMVPSFFISICNSQNLPGEIYKNDLHKIDITGHVIKLEQFHFNASTFGGEEKIYRRTEMGGYNKIQYFDSSGNITSENSIKNDSTIAGVTYYIYDKTLLKNVINTYDSFKFKTIYLYNENQKLIKRVEFDEKDDTSRIVYYFYNKTGKITQIISDDKKGSTLDYVEEYKYQPKKNITKTIIYDENNSVFENRTYKYNSNGRLSKQTIKRGKTLISVHYEYNDKGLLIQENRTDNLGMKSKSTLNYNYEYDTKGNWVKKSVYYLYSFDGEVFIRKITYQ